MGINRSMADIGASLQPLGIGYVSRTGSIQKTLRNAAPMAAQVDTLTPSAGTADETLTLTLLPSGESVASSMVVDITASHGTAVLLGAAIAAAWNAYPSFYGWATASADGATGVVTITGASFTESFVVTSTVTASGGGAGITTVVAATATTYADADAIPFGRLMVRVGDDTAGRLNAYGSSATPLGALARSSRLTARVDTHTLTYEAGIDWTLVVSLDGVPYSATITQATDAPTSATAMQAALAGVLPAEVVATVNAAVITLTAAVGYSMASSSRFESGAATAAAVIASVGAGINDVLRGVSVATNAEEQPAGGGDAAYPAKAGVIVLTKGYIMVESSETVSHGGPVYVDIGDTAAAGRFYASAGPNRIRLLGASWVRNFTNINRAELALES